MRQSPLEESNPIFRYLFRTISYDEFEPSDIKLNEISDEVRSFFYHSACLNGEAGELFKLAQKSVYNNELPNKDDIGDEIVDVLWYSYYIAKLLDIDLDKYTAKKSTKIINRIRSGYYNGEKHEG